MNIRLILLRIDLSKIYFLEFNSAGLSQILYCFSKLEITASIRSAEFQGFVNTE